MIYGFDIHHNHIIATINEIASETCRALKNIKRQIKFD